MYSKTIFIFVSTLLLKTINGQLCGTNPYHGFIGNGMAADNLILGNPGLAHGPFAGLPCAPIIAETPLTYGPSIVENFPVSSLSHIPPGTLSIFSDNLIIEGPIIVSGQLPFLASVAVQGELPAAGRGAVSFGCGNGEVGITNEGVIPPAMPFGYGNFGFPGEIGFGSPIGPNFRGYI
ncbi:PREDICTED: chorion class B protein M2807-like [Papilio xuthus]|uniref:Chorion class B protein M2807-like n=1 Tax=Papilio xuthus TaxID=66420 RepID=A0AAJ7EFP8_PAPXU|nr:PREDICTED: chorion class B protein M2807-like [Papilio xuthus]